MTIARLPKIFVRTLNLGFRHNNGNAKGPTTATAMKKVHRLSITLTFFTFAICCCSSMPKSIGLLQGRLYPCPESPNCVCSQDRSGEHGIDPLTYVGDLQHAKTMLLAVLDSLPRVRFITENENYWHVEFRSALFRFVDDVEFLFDPTASRIQVRSASRLGHSDLGVNRKRIEQIRNLFKTG